MWDIKCVGAPVTLPKFPLGRESISHCILRNETSARLVFLTKAQTGGHSLIKITGVRLYGFYLEQHSTRTSYLKSRFKINTETNFLRHRVDIKPHLSDPRRKNEEKMSRRMDSNSEMGPLVDKNLKCVRPRSPIFWETELICHCILISGG